MTNRELDHPTPEFVARGLGDMLARYVLVEHLRASGVEFDAHQTALDHASLSYRIENAMHLGINTHGISFANHQVMDAATDGADKALQSALHKPEAQVVDPYPNLSICDRERLLDGIEKLGAADLRKLLMLADDGTLNQEYGASEAVAKRLAAIVGEVVLIRAQAAFKLTQGTAEGETPATQTYDPAVPGSAELTLSECAITDAGARIDALGSGPYDATKQVLTVRNGLSGRKILLTGSDSKSTVMTVMPNATRILYASDLKHSWAITVEAVSA